MQTNTEDQSVGYQHLACPSQFHSQGKITVLCFGLKKIKMSKERKVKLIIVGDSAVGKTKLLERFLLEGFTHKTESTYALSIYNYKCMVKNEEVNVEIWDTAGQERFSKVHESFYQGAHSCILVFDITRKISYTHLEKWYGAMREWRKRIPCILVGNKIDCDKSVTKKRFEFATKRNLTMLFASAASGDNVVKIFMKAIEDGVNYVKNPPEDDITGTVVELLEGSSSEEEDDEDDSDDDGKMIGKYKKKNRRIIIKE